MKASTTVLTLLLSSGLARAQHASAYVTEQGARCGGAPSIHLEDDPSQRAQLSAGPLNILAQWDSSLLSEVPEPYDITASSNRLLLRINGVTISTMTLTIGNGRTAADMAAELNANPAFSARCEASTAFTMPAYLYLRTKGATLGSIEVFDTTSSAHTALGLPLGYHAADMGAAERIVIQTAIAEWEAMLLDGGLVLSPLPIRVRATPGSSAAGANGVYSGPYLVGGDMGFNETVNWFVDPTPWEDSEFTGGNPPTGYDLLTYARHELCHILGFTGGGEYLDVTTTLTVPLSASATSAVVASTDGFFDQGDFSVNGERIDYTSKTPTLLLGLSRESPQNHAVGSTVLCNDVWDSTRLNIAVDGAHAHRVIHAEDLMVFAPGIGRRGISLYPDVARIARTMYATVPFAVLDPDGSPTPDGRASYPWPDLASAAAGTAWGVPFLLTDGTHLETTLPLAVTDAHEFMSVRGARTLFR